MKRSKSVISIVSAISMLILISGCKNNDIQKASTEDISSPPSLQTEKGELMVTLDEKQANRLSIETLIVKKEIQEFKIETNGIAVPSHDHYAVVSAPINGIVSALYYHEGEQVEKGESLLELESLDYANLVADFIESATELNYLNNQVSRLTKLIDEKITTEQEFNKALADQGRVKARYETLKNRLKLLDKTDRELDAWVSNPEKASASLMIKSPIDGRIHEHFIDLGQPVKAYEKMMDVLDPIEVIVKGYLSPLEVQFVEPGDSLWVYGKRKQSDLRYLLTKGTVNSINPALNEDNRFISVNSHIKSKDGRPAAGEQLNLTYNVTSSDSLIKIPKTSLIYNADQPGVFIKRGDDSYVFRPIDILRMSEEEILISSGISNGEEVVINQVFSLKALLRFEIFGE